MTEEDKIKRREAKNNRYRNMSEEQKVKKREYEKNWYRNMSKEQKNKIRKYARDRYHTMIKVHWYFVDISYAYNYIIYTLLPSCSFKYFESSDVIVVKNKNLFKVSLSLCSNS